MAKQIEGVYERVVQCAKQEFLLRGFKDASLRTIAKNAKTSTGSIYTRFGDKEGLFRAIVEPVVQEFQEFFRTYLDVFDQMEGIDKEREMPEYSGRGMEKILDFIYLHFEEFELLLDASYGTGYQNFIGELVDIEVRCTYRYMKDIQCGPVQSGEVTEEFLHIVTTAYFNGMFEVVRRRMDKEEALRYSKLLMKYHMAGFDTIFYPEKY